MYTENYTEEMKCIEIIESHDSVNRMVRTNILGFKHRHQAIDLYGLKVKLQRAYGGCLGASSR